MARHLKAIKWSIQCASDNHKLSDFHRYLSKADKSLTRFEDELGPLHQKLGIDIKAFWASYYFKIASYQKAIATHKEIIQTIQRKDSLTFQDKKLIGRSYQYLGTIAKLRGDFHEAIANYWSSLDPIRDQWEEYEKLGRIALTFRQIAKCYQSLDDPEKAQLYNYQALASLEKVYLDERTTSCFSTERTEEQ